MKILVLLSILALVLYVHSEADSRQDRAASEKVASRGPNVHPAEKRRFKTKPSCHGKDYYQKMIGLRTSPAYWKKSGTGNIYKALTSVFSDVKLPKQFSWTDKPGIVTPIKHQGECGSGYSFASVGAIESMLAIWTKKPNLDLSEQEIVDCSQQTGNFGCNGGLMENVYQWIANNKGLTLENVYPYKGVAGQCGRLNVTNYARGMTFARVLPGNEEGLRSVVYHLGPVGIGIHANFTSFFNYTEGVYDAEECNTGAAQIDHAVLLVGWGVKDGDPYWLIKNSWGTEWGEKGYMKLLRGKGQCKIGRMAAAPIFEWAAKKFLNRKAVWHNIR